MELVADIVAAYVSNHEMKLEKGESGQKDSPCKIE